MGDPGLDVTEDAALGGRLRLKQPRRGHRFGHDGILLAAATAARPGDHVVDLGAGIGIAGLALAARVADTTITLVDSEARLLALAAENAESNGLAARVRLIHADIAAPTEAFASAGLQAGSVAHVLMNPPFHDPARQNQSPDSARSHAHMAADDTLATWTRTAARLLAAKGGLTLIWRADGLAAVLAAIEREFGGIAILPVHPRPGVAAIRLLVRAVKGSRAPLAMLPGLFLNGEDGRPTAEAEAVLRAGAALPLALL
jgi:tRNA1(Val) A37 N6-methylase TrmN6